MPTLHLISIALRAKRASGVGTGEKVLVSCFIWAMTSFMGGLQLEWGPAILIRTACGHSHQGARAPRH